MKTVIVSENISPACERSLLVRGFSLLKLPTHPHIKSAVGAHPDGLIFKYKREILTPADLCDAAPHVFSDLREMCPEISISFTSDEPTSKYPYDTPMNAKVIGKYLFAKVDSVSKSVLGLAARHGLTVVNTKQGYPACTTLAIGENAITADRGMAKVLESYGIKVTVIENGGISLPPHEYGFIGGASGCFGGKVYFFGNIDAHPSADIIKSWCNDLDHEPVSLSNEPLADLGGMIFAD